MFKRIIQNIFICTAKLLIILSISFFLLFPIITINNNSSLLFSDIILNEVMYNPIGSEHHTEFVEIFNNGSNAVDLTGYKISDGSDIDGLVVYPGFDNMMLNSNSYCLIMDSSYPTSGEDYYEHLIPDSILRVIIEDGSFGSYGFSNTLAETLFVYDNNDLIVSSYTYSIDQEPGFSDEKIFNYIGSSNADENWGNSLTIDGTPGFKNSISPWDFDIALEVDSEMIPNVVEQNTDVEIGFVVKNQGLNVLNDFRYNIVLDDLLIVSFEYLGTIPVNDSLYFSEIVSFVNISSGNAGLKIELESEEDESLDNNIFEKDIFVNYSSESTLSINEFKKNPQNEECEWLEIINISNDSILMSNFGFSDSNHNNYSSFISIYSDYYLQPDSFFVIAKDSSIFEFYDFLENDELDNIEINSSFPTLNNTDDKIFLYTKSGTVIDSIFYNEDSWYEDDSGRSIEKINQTLNPNEPENWNVSVNSGTPCRVNSIFQDIEGNNNSNKENFIELLSKSVSPNGDGEKDNLIVNYNFESAYIYATAIIFNIKGQKVEQISNNEYKRGEGSIIWDCKDYKNFEIPIGVYILYFKAKNDQGKLFEFKEAFYIVI